MELNIPELPEPEEVPKEPIGAFHVTSRDQKKAIKVRKMLAMDAPATAGEHIRNTPIKVMPKIQKNRMFAVMLNGTPVLEINLKSGELRFTDTVPIYP